MIRLRISLILLCSLFITQSALASFAVPETPAGRWLTADQSAVIQIGHCGDGLCGQLVGIHLAHAGDPMPRDWQGQPQCGLTIVQTTSTTNDSGKLVWHGVVLDPRNGVSHPALLFFDAAQNLVLRGYAFLPIFGRSTTWTKYTGQTLPGCQLPG